MQLKTITPGEATRRSRKGATLEEDSARFPCKLYPATFAHPGAHL